MQARFDESGALLLRVPPGEDEYARLAGTVAAHVTGRRLLTNLLEEGFTGVKTDTKGVKRTYSAGKPVPNEPEKPGFTGIDAHGHKWENGVQVAIGRDEGTGQAVQAKLDGETVHVTNQDPNNGLAKVRTKDGQERIVRTDELELHPDAEDTTEPEQETEPGGYQFYSPNVKENVKFDEALKNLGTAEQAKFLSTSNDVLEQIGVNHHAENAVGDWKDGAENSVMQTIDGNIDKATLRYSASLIGEMAEQKAVLTFMNDPNGKDALYQMELSAPIGEVRAKLAEKGIAFRTLVPTKTGCKVVIFDQGDALLNKVITVGDDFDATIQQTRGDGEFIGAEDRNGASAEYRKAIDEYEKEPNRPKYQAGGGDNRGGLDAGQGTDTGASEASAKPNLTHPITKDKVTPPPPSKGDARLYEPDPTADSTGDGVADASRVGVPAAQVPPPPSIGRLPRLTKNERLVESRFADAFEANPKAMVDDYAAKKNHVVAAVVKAKNHPESAKAAEAAGFKVQVKTKKDGTPDEFTINGEEPKLSEFLKQHAANHALVYEIGDAPNIFNTDDAKMLSDVYNPSAASGIARNDVLDMRSRYNTVLHQTSNAIAKKAFLEYLDKLPEDKKTVLVTSGGVAAGKGFACSKVPSVNSIATDAGAVWDAAGEANSTENTWIMAECEKRGIKPTFLYVHSNPNETWENPQRGVVERAGKIGRMVDARLFADSYTLGAKNFDVFHKANKDKAQFFILDNTGKDPKQVDEVPKEALQMDPDELYHRSVDFLQKGRDVKPAVQRGGLNGLRIWPEKSQANTTESLRADGNTVSFRLPTGEIVVARRQDLTEFVC